MYRHLDPDKLIATLERLQRRIEERFPHSSLAGVCNELCGIARSSRERSEWIARPNWWLRTAVGLVVALMLVTLVYSLTGVELSLGRVALVDLVQVSEAATNELVLIGAALLFLVTAEVRLKRSRALEALHELRTIAHVIDMHQLTKDPGRLRPNVILTASSPQPGLGPYELTRYLDYCSEMLSLTGKIAALYGQCLADAVVLSSVNELEALTTGLCRKIWQKIMVLHRLDADAPGDLDGPVAA